MLKLIIFAASLALVCAAFSGPIEYPPARRGDTVDVLHGQAVPDPYRWLEDPNSAETRAWIEAQNKLAFGYLAAIPERDRIAARLTEAWNFERFGMPFKEGGRYFYTRNSGLQRQSVLYVADRLDAEPRVLLDPNELSEDGTIAASGYSVSRDGKHLAYSVSSGGSDWQTLRVRSVATGKDLEDKIEWAKFTGIAWDADGKGFYYSRYDAPGESEKLSGRNEFHKLYYHRLGVPQSEDALIYERKDKPTWGFGATVTDDGRYLIVSVWDGTRRENGVLYKDLRDRSLVIRELVLDFDASYDFIGSKGPVFFFQTDLDAPLGRVIAIDIRKPARSEWKTIIPERTEALQAVGLVGDRFFASYLKDATSIVVKHDLNGKKVGMVELPGLGSVGGFGGRSTDNETFYTFTSFNSPNTIFRYDVKSGKSSVFRKPKLAVDVEAIEVRQLFYASKDGTKVPIFIAHRKGLKLDGRNPTLLYGYGGFQASMTPFFSIVNSIWMEMGGVFAMACIRGGGEYGKPWHDGGRLHKKQNGFDDFIAAMEFLVKERYTSADRLAIQGGSNGGLLVGAMMTQRPDLFAVALPAVGVLDMLRFHKFTIGWAWKSDYGDPDKKEDFEVLKAYSPLHNLRPGTKYPATLVTTGDHDDRVVPAHSFKFTAELQRCQAGSSPVLIRIETRGGHGAGKPLQMYIAERADELAFAVRNLGMRLPDDFGK